MQLGYGVRCSSELLCHLAPLLGCYAHPDFWVGYRAPITEVAIKVIEGVIVSVGCGVSGVGALALEIASSTGVVVRVEVVQSRVGLIGIPIRSVPSEGE